MLLNKSQYHEERQTMTCYYPGNRETQLAEEYKLGKTKNPT